MDQLFVLFLSVTSFANTFLPRIVSFWTYYTLEWLQLCTVYPELQTTDCSSVSDRTLNYPRLLLSGLDSRDYLGHTAGTVLGNPCPCCSLLVESLLNVRKEILIFWVLFFRAVTSSVVSAGVTSEHKISGGYTVPLKFPFIDRRYTAGGRQI